MKKMKRSKTKVHVVAPEIVAEAAALVGQYQVVISHEDGEYVARGLEYRNCVGSGKTPGEAIEECKGNMQAVVEAQLEDGELPAIPASAGTRTEQINIRVSPEEKLRMESIAARKGFKGIADYVRAAALV